MRESKEYVSGNGFVIVAACSVTIAVGCGSVNLQLIKEDESSDVFKKEPNLDEKR